MEFLTKIVNPPACPGEQNHPTTIPIYQTATFWQEDAEASGPYDYSRSGNPTRDVLEQHIAHLEGAKYALVYNSGLSAVNAVFEHLSPGDEVITGLDIYGGTARLFQQVLPGRGIQVIQVDTRNLDAIQQVLTSKTKLIWLETPSNPLLQISDIAAIARLSSAHSILLAVDNSLLGHLQKPLDHGADLVIYSATKHFSGHSDLTAGVITTHSDDLAKKLKFNQNATGSALAPFDAWLLLRGIKTLGIRMQQQQNSAIQIAAHLQKHPLIKAVYFPVDDPIHQKQASGPGCVLSVELVSAEAATHWVNRVKLFYIAASFGCVHSFISIPRKISHAAVKSVHAPSDALVRLSIGIEAVSDLIADLDQALEGL